MTILYLLKQDPEATFRAIMEEHKKTESVKVVDLRESHNYDEIVDEIISSDKVIVISI
jgi:hypothetical protein